MFWLKEDHVKSMKFARNSNKIVTDEDYGHHDGSFLSILLYHFIYYAIICQRIDSTVSFRYLRAILWPMAMYIMCYEVSL